MRFHVSYARACSARACSARACSAQRAATCGLALAALTLGCAAPFQRVPEDERQTRPAPGKALVYILYTGSGWGGTFATLFCEDAPGEDRYVGTLFHGTHLTLQLDPGDYLFAVVGNTVDLMSATVEAGKVYHAAVASYLAPENPFRANYGNYRFEPINDPDDPRLAEWLATSVEARPTTRGEADGAKQKKRLAKMKPEYEPRWRAKADPQHLFVPTP